MVRGRKRALARFADNRAGNGLIEGSDAGVTGHRGGDGAWA